MAICTLIFMLVIKIKKLTAKMLVLKTEFVPIFNDPPARAADSSADAPVLGDPIRELASPAIERIEKNQAADARSDTAPVEDR